LVYFVIPESPRWHLSKGRTQIAADIVNGIIKRSGGRVLPISVEDLGGRLNISREPLPPYWALFARGQLRWTVVGILAAFQSMAVMGTGGFSVVAAGISEALISTALGLAVAIIAVIFYNYFSQKVERINATIHICAARLIDAAIQGQQTNGH